MLKNRKILGALSIAFALSSIGNLAYADATPLIGALAQNSDGVPSLAPLIEKAIPAVVNISVNGKKSLNRDAFDIPEEFRFFFPDIQQRERKFSALGSGVIIDAKKGYVITNHHVIDGADEIKVGTPYVEGAKVEAKVLKNGKAKKIVVMTYKPKKNEKRKLGHRQPYTKVEITEIVG